MSTGKRTSQETPCGTDSLGPTVPNPKPIKKVVKDFCWFSSRWSMRNLAPDVRMNHWGFRGFGEVAGEWGGASAFRAAPN